MSGTQKTTEKYAIVVVPIPNDEGFTYRIPGQFSQVLQSGSQVVVPFGKRFLSGVVVSLSNTIPANLSEDSIKMIRDVVYPQPLVSSEMRNLLRWISDYYICHLGEAYRLIQASLNVGSTELMIRKVPGADIRDLPDSYKIILDLIPDDQPVSLKKLEKKAKDVRLLAYLTKLQELGVVSRDYSTPARKQAIATEDFFRLKSSYEMEESSLQTYEELARSRGSKIQLFLSLLSKQEWVSMKSLRDSGIARQTVNRFLDAGILVMERQAVERRFDSGYFEEPKEIVVTPEQEGFINKVWPFLKKGEFGTFLLHGITGSGKTQVYIELIQRVASLGKQSIILIPEIVLTPQTLTRFSHYFGDRVAVLHSRLSTSERREILFRIRRGDFDLVLGPRSAIFAPFGNIGLVIVDEEHEPSYKQTDAQPHYHARDVAIYRAKLNNAVVVLGSATPSFESLYNARTGKYEYYFLEKRISARSLPRISIVDLKAEWKKCQEYPIISQNLELQVESRLLTKEQTMILQNRRGFAPYIMCKDCGYIARCPNCDITLTFHYGEKQLICHYCDYHQNPPDVCPECQSLDIMFKGIGTERLEHALRETFPHGRILRMDQDTTRGKQGHLQILEKFRSGEGDILIGTKMIAKGLDFERVSLVGIISADQGLHFPDFRSAEKVFQLLIQASGRAGRGDSAGEVIIQTFDPSHYIFNYLITHDYTAFYKKEMEGRQKLKYPPFSRLILLRIEGRDLELVKKYSEIVVKFLWKANEQKRFSVLGPAPAALSRIKNIHRYQVLIKQDKKLDGSMAYLRHLIKQTFYVNLDVKKWPVKVIIDVDPVDIL